MRKHFLLFILYSSLLSGCYQQQSKMTLKNNGVLNTYTLVNDWLHLPNGYAMGTPTGLGIDSNGHIFIFSRAGREWTTLMPILSTPISGKTIHEIDAATGELLNSWGDHFFVMPHGLTIDADDNVWVTDVALQQVFKFNHQGKLLMTLGEAEKAGRDATHFNMPTGVAVAKDGSFYVSDGYGNSRVVKFSAEGKCLFEWGTKGGGPDEFDIPHAIELDDNGHVYVADRENHRIQAFDSNGRLLKIIEDKSFGNLCSIVFDKNEKHLLAVDDMISMEVKHKGSDVIVFDTAGTSFSVFGRSGNYSGPICWYHDIAIDKQGNIYVADLLNGIVQKFKRK